MRQEGALYRGYRERIRQPISMVCHILRGPRMWNRRPSPIWASKT